MLVYRVYRQGFAVALIMKHDSHGSGSASQPRMIPGHTTDKGATSTVGFKLATDGIRFYVFVNYAKISHHGENCDCTVMIMINIQVIRVTIYESLRL